MLPDVGGEEEVEATPRQLERLLEESNSSSSRTSATSSSASPPSSPVSPDSGLQLEVQVAPPYHTAPSSTPPLLNLLLFLYLNTPPQEVYIREQGMEEAEDTVMESRSILRSTADHVR